MIKVVQARSKHREEVIDLLDEFSFVCSKIIGIQKKIKIRDNYENPVFDDIIVSDNSAIFLAQRGDIFIGILTIHRIPLLRKGIYEYAEIEEMFVQEGYQGSNAAQKLMDNAVLWAKEKSITSIQLKSHELLTRAHNFYEKNGFESYGKVFEKCF